MSRIHTLLQEGTRIPRRELPTVDFLVTLLRGDESDGLGYCGLTIKPAGKLKSRATVRQVVRDREFCEQQGWSWQLVTDRDVNAVTAQVAKQVIVWAKDFDIEPSVAQLLAHEVKHGKSSPDLKGTLTRAAARTGIDAEHVHAVFATAVLYGHLQLDSTKALSLRKPLHLATKS